VKERDFWLILLGLAIGVPVGIVIIQHLSKSTSVAVEDVAVKPIHNTETWMYQDWQGKERKIEVHRTVD